MKKLNNNNFGIFRICFVDSLLSEELGQLVGGVRALDVLPGADLGLLVGAGQSSELVLSAGMDGVDSGLSVLEELDNTGLIGVQFIDGFSDNMADQKFATVSQVDGGNGIEKDVHLGRSEGGGLGITTSTASAKFGQDKAFSGQGQSSDGGNSDGHLGTGKDVSGSAKGQGEGVEGHGDGGDAGNDGNGELVHLDIECLVVLVGLRIENFKEVWLPVICRLASKKMELRTIV
jgi:hypothetical protein